MRSETESYRRNRNETGSCPDFGLTVGPKNDTVEIRPHRKLNRRIALRTLSGICGLLVCSPKQLRADETLAATDALESQPPISVPVWGGREIASAASQNSSAAALLSQEASKLERLNASSHHSSNGPCLLARVLRLQADHERKRSIMQALQAHFGLIALQALLPVTKSAEENLQEQRTTIGRLAESGVATDQLGHELTLGNQALADQILQRKDQEAQLRSSLQLLTNDSLAWSYQPEETLEVQFRELDRDALLATAYANRSDLAALETLRAGLSAGTVDSTSNAISMVMPGLGLSTKEAAATAIAFPGLSKIRHLLGWDHANQSKVRDQARQIDSAIDALRRKIANEVQVGAESTQIAYQRASLASETVTIHQQRLEQLDRGLELGMAQPTHRVEAIDRFLKAKVEYFLRLSEARQAELKLIESCGTADQWSDFLYPGKPNAADSKP